MPSFHYLNKQIGLFAKAGEPVISVDTKKKEIVGEFSNGGAEWHPAGEPTRTKTHDFVDKELGRAVPYGVYDLANDEAGSASATPRTQPVSPSKPSDAGGRPWVDLAFQTPPSS